jgi:RNA 3'-terminal phosphate cyclase (ATP)
MIELDGSQGEGGGQILRSALTLSMVTGQPFQIHHIRANRSKPGLMAQHLKAVDAAAAACRANVIGASLGATSLVFEPGKIRSGRYKFEIGTAGSTSLVLQTVLVPLSMTNTASTVILSGGTHVPWSPCYHYLEEHWRPLLLHLGFQFQLALECAGFYPQGGGRVQAVIRPLMDARSIAPLHLDRRGKLQRIYGLSAVAGLDKSIADRQKRQAVLRLQNHYPLDHFKTVELPARISKGTLFLLVAEFDPLQGNEHAQCCYYALGEHGKPAERVADEAVDALEDFLQTEATVDQYLADQLLLPLSLASGSSVIRTPRITSHILTNAEVIRRFLSVEIQVQGNLGAEGLVQITPSASLMRESLNAAT